MTWNGFFHASRSSLSVVFPQQPKKKKKIAELRILLQTTYLFYLLSSFPVSFSFKGPPELHSAKLLTFCSSFAFVPFVSVIERERKEFRREECEGMFVSWTRMGGRQGGAGGGGRRAKGSGSSG